MTMKGLEQEERAQARRAREAGIGKEKLAKERGIVEPGKTLTAQRRSF